jgi:hypothetical protein
MTGSTPRSSRWVEGTPINFGVLDVAVTAMASGERNPWVTPFSWRSASPFASACMHARAAFWLIEMGLRVPVDNARELRVEACAVKAEDRVAASARQEVNLMEEGCWWLCHDPDLLDEDFVTKMCAVVPGVHLILGESSMSGNVFFVEDKAVAQNGAHPHELIVGLEILGSEETHMGGVRLSRYLGSDGGVLAAVVDLESFRRNLLVPQEIVATR